MKTHTPYSIKHNSAFTLVELLVVMAILGILATLITGGFKTALMRGRDTERKSDLRQIANALELFYHDWGYYPPASDGKIFACPFFSDPNTCAAECRVCKWGEDEEFTDRQTVYLKKIPKDPYVTLNYVYRLSGGSNKKFQLFARVENPQDQDCLEGNCVVPSVPSGVTCGINVNCNFAVTSTNTNATEE